MKRIEKGDVIGDTYKVLAIIGGEGHTGMGIVYICQQIKGQNLILALKTYQDRFIASKEIMNSFKREGLVWIKLDYHPNIVMAKGFFDFDNRLYIALEYVANDRLGRNTLTHYLCYPIPLQLAIKWSVEFCYGMEHAISHGVSAHRDIKPDNIMITYNKILKVTDFGLSKLFDQKQSLKEFNTSESTNFSNLSIFQNSKGHTIAGTPPWMAPEQFEGKADIRSDVYSFGIVLYQIVNHGKLPFISRTLDGFHYKHRNETIPRFQSPLYPIIERCLEKNPEDRYPDFRKLRLDLEDVYKNKTGENITFLLKNENNKTLQLNLKGYSLLILGLYDDAIPVLEEVIKLDKSDYDSYVNLGNCYANKGLFDKSIEIHNQGIKIDPKKEACYINLAFDLYSKGEALLKEGLIKQGEGLIKQAKKTTEKALKINPNSAEAYVNLANYYRIMKNNKKAIELLKKSIKINPNLKQSYLLIARDYYDLREYEKSIDYLQRVLKIDPSLDKACYFLAKIFYEIADDILIRSSVTKTRDKFKHQIISLNNNALAMIKNALDIDPKNEDYKKEYDELKEYILRLRTLFKNSDISN